jgi:hypothetical protein
MRICPRLIAAALIAAALLTLAAADQAENRPIAPPTPAPGDRPARPGPTAPDSFPPVDAAKRPAAPDRTARQSPQPEPQPIELSGRLRRPVKWTPQLELVPRGRDIARIDLQGNLLRDLEDGTPIRVRGVVRSWLHRGDTAANRSPFPAQWMIQLEVTELEILEDPGDVLKADDDALLHELEQTIRTALPELEQDLEFEYPTSSRSLVVNYRTRTFMVHGQSRSGEFDEQAHETIGPGHTGFQLKLHVQDAGAVNAAVVPATIRGPYWATDLDVHLLEGTDKQVYAGLSYGSRVDEALLNRVRDALHSLGTAPSR